jgi:hypothetical protein
MAKLHLSKDFKEFIQLLIKNNVRFMVVGAYAVGLHGYVRFTGDLDIWVEASGDNSQKILTSLYEFGFSTLSGLSAEDFTKEDSVVQLGYPPLRIDLMTSVSGIDFESCYPKRETQLIDGIEIPYLDLLSLKQNKLSTNRKKDLGDLENLP